MSIILLVDSSASINKTTAKKYNIDILSYNLIFEEKIYKDVIEVRNHNDLGDLISRHKSLPRFDLMEKDKIQNTFKKYIENGYDILYICVGSKMSNAYKRILEISKEFDSNNIQVIDSMNVGIGQTLLALAAREYIDNGYGLKQVTKYINLVKNSIKTYYAIGESEYLYNQNRCKDISLNYLDYYHKIPIAEIKQGQIFLTFSTKENEIALQILKNAIMDNKKNLSDLPIIISYSGDKSIAIKLKNYVTKNFSRKVMIFETSSIVYINSGINTIGLAFLTNR